MLVYFSVVRMPCLSHHHIFFVLFLVFWTLFRKNFEFTQKYTDKNTNTSTYLFFITFLVFFNRLYQDCCSVTQWVNCGFRAKCCLFFLSSQGMRALRGWGEAGVTHQGWRQSVKSPFPGSLRLARAVSHETHPLSPGDGSLGILGQQVPGVHGLCSCPPSAIPCVYCFQVEIERMGRPRMGTCVWLGNMAGGPGWLLRSHGVRGL